VPPPALLAARAPSNRAEP